ncbi:methionine ABC transporter ATP-binding protein [Micrococcus cohnii]|uniref:D-methionine transport system ATP-binding protein n=1 Tax=Micrococcus cohnii TaxID=993416 RepID=A0A7W7GN02_9MICC|nr:methionine ABC transporter ATP-binding protein [Micrococcus cohnii]MBB4735133.1 D-methionine transport system ATP-binding protein [Micrococcus cohnii]
MAAAHTAAGEPVIVFDSVSREFGGKGRVVRAVDDVSLTVHRGEVFGVIGFSGAGKSTLIRMINGLEKPTSGTVTVLGQQVSHLSEAKLRPLRTRIGMVFQQFNLMTSRTVAGNVNYALATAGWPRATRKARVAELLDFVGLADKARHYPEQLSGGQKQRVGIARALAAEPEVLLADEATSALDPSTTGEVLSVLRRVNEELGVTIVAITHEMEVIRSIADRVAVMDSGRIVESGPVYDLFSNPEHAEGAASFVATALKDRPNREEAARIRARTGGRLVTVSLKDSAAVGRVLGHAAGYGVEFEIVHGGMSATKDSSYGVLTVALNGDEQSVQRFIENLGAAGALKEVAA